MGKTLQDTTRHCKTLQDTTRHSKISRDTAAHDETLRDVARHQVELTTQCSHHTLLYRAGGPDFCGVADMNTQCCIRTRYTMLCQADGSDTVVTVLLYDTAIFQTHLHRVVSVFYTGCIRQLHPTTDHRHNCCVEQT